MKPLLKKTDKGIAGLEILLSVVVMLFVIGFIIMIFAILGSQLEEDAWNDRTAATAVNNESLLTVDDDGEFFPTAIIQNKPICTIVHITNESAGYIVEAANYTATDNGCRFVAAQAQVEEYNGTNVNVSYTYTYLPNSTASDVIASSYNELSNTTDWFGIIIVISAMVVLILLTVIIISAIRGSGLIGGVRGGGKAPRTSA